MSNEIRKIVCEVWTRVVGYHRPESQCNKGKKEEISQRKTYDVNKEVKKLFGTNKKSD